MLGSLDELRLGGASTACQCFQLGPQKWPAWDGAHLPCSILWVLVLAMWFNMVECRMSEDHLWRCCRQPSLCRIWFGGYGRAAAGGGALQPQPQLLSAHLGALVSSLAAPWHRQAGMWGKWLHAYCTYCNRAAPRPCGSLVPLMVGQPL